MQDNSEGKKDALLGSSHFSHGVFLILFFFILMRKNVSHYVGMPIPTSN